MYVLLLQLFRAHTHVRKAGIEERKEELCVLLLPLHTGRYDPWALAAPDETLLPRKHPMTRMNRFPAALAAATLLAGALAACSDAPTGAAPESGPSLAEQVAALGFRADMIEDHGEYVLVEGDIYLSKAQLRSAGQQSTDPLQPRFQYVTNNLVSNSKIYQIRVDLSGLNSQPGWQNAARDAIAHWSGIASSHVEMVEGTPADITVGTTCTSWNVAAYASFPSGGNPGSTIYVNTCFGYSTTHAQKVHNMVHELGHTIGFRHSNYVQMGESAGVEGANHIWGTPTSGNASGSVMNGGTALNSWAGFAASDVTATQSRYPIPGPGSYSVTNSNGTPLISWAAVSGATSYTVSLITFNTVNGQYQNHWVNPITTTTSTSYLDVDRIYTGVYECTYDWSWGGETQGAWYEYAVQANFPHGSSPVLNSRFYAPIAQPGCVY
jgi:hypothetical protein